jgi:hypothetical protein
MYIEGQVNGWSFECGTDRWAFYGTWMGLPDIEVSGTCPPHSGYTLVNWTSYGGAIYDNHYPLSWPQTQTWDTY